MEEEEKEEGDVDYAWPLLLIGLGIMILFLGIPTLVAFVTNPSLPFDLGHCLAVILGLIFGSWLTQSGIRQVNKRQKLIWAIWFVMGAIVLGALVWVLPRGEVRIASVLALVLSAVTLLIAGLLRTHETERD